MPSWLEPVGPERLGSQGIGRSTQWGPCLVRRVVEVQHVGEVVGLGERAQNLLVDLVADIGRALEGDHIGEARARRHGNGREGLAGEAIADVFHEQQH